MGSLAEQATAVPRLSRGQPLQVSERRLRGTVLQRAPLEVGRTVALRVDSCPVIITFEDMHDCSMIIPPRRLPVSWPAALNFTPRPMRADLSACLISGHGHANSRLCAETVYSRKRLQHMHLKLCPI